MGAQGAEGLQQGRPSGRRESSPLPLPNLGASPRRAEAAGVPSPAARRLQPPGAPGCSAGGGRCGGAGRGTRAAAVRTRHRCLPFLPFPPRRPPGAVVPAGPRTQRAGDRLSRPGLAPRPLPAVPRTPPSLPGCHVTPPPAGTAAAAAGSAPPRSRPRTASRPRRRGSGTRAPAVATAAPVQAEPGRRAFPPGKRGCATRRVPAVVLGRCGGAGVGSCPRVQRGGRGPAGRCAGRRRR